MKAVICPVCQGEGECYHPLHNDTSVDMGYYLPCHGCRGSEEGSVSQKGRGWVEVHEETIVEPNLNFTFIPHVPIITSVRQ